MNARRHVIDLSCDARQVEECVSCLFHTILFHRCMGKFKFREEHGQQNIVIGTVGYESCDCKTVDLTYIRCSSPKLCSVISAEIKPFASALVQGSSIVNASISLEFYEKRARGAVALMGYDKLPWEIWVIRFTLAHLTTEAQRQRYRHEMANVLSDKMLMIVDVMNRYEYTPKNPQREELDLVFDTNYPDVQPYLFRVNRDIDANPNQSVSKSLGRFFRDTLEI